MGGSGLRAKLRALERRQRKANGQKGERSQRGGNYCNYGCGSHVSSQSRRIKHERNCAMNPANQAGARR